MCKRSVLDGVRILDVTQMLAGPLAGMRLGDFGADVIKIEPVGTGEFNRRHGFEDVRIDGEMSTFVAVNRNKRSLALNLKDARGRDVFKELVRASDVILENFRIGTVERLGIDYGKLREINDGLIYCSISGYGRSGPYKDRPGQDLIIQGYSGSMYSVGTREDPPLPGALWAADVMSGYQAVIGILAALLWREKAGIGQYVEVSMLNTVLDAEIQELVTYMSSGVKPVRTEEWSAHALIPAPYGVYKTLDGWMCMAMTDLPRIGRLLDDEMLMGFINYNDGAIHRDEVYKRLKHAFEEHETAYWLRACDEVGVWVGPVYDYEDVISDPHIMATGMFTWQPGGRRQVRTVKPPLAMSETDLRIEKGAPKLGEHSREVLREIGLSEADITELIEARVVGATEVRDDK